MQRFQGRLNFKHHAPATISFRLVFIPNPLGNKRYSGESLSSAWVHSVLVWVQAETESLDELAQGSWVLVCERLEEVDQSLLCGLED